MATSTVIRRVRKTARRTRRRVDRVVAKATGINAGWSQSAATVSSAACLIGGSERIRLNAAAWLHPHEGCHLAAFAEINRYIDAGGGWAHRATRGHSIEWLPDLVSRFGLKAIPAYAAHVTQDLTTKHGIPLLPFAGRAYFWLIRRGVKPSLALRLVSVNIAQIAAGVGVVLTVYQLFRLGQTIYKQLQEKNSLVSLTEGKSAC